MRQNPQDGVLATGRKGLSYTVGPTEVRYSVIQKLSPTRPSPKYGGIVKGVGGPRGRDTVPAQ